jgi:protein tyrosine phosphatase (PTP) superfamily phosphohydrolase (DUF442 family)
MTTQDPSPWPKGIGAPAQRALAAAGYSRLEDLTAVREVDLAALHGMGPKGLSVLREALAARGLSFAADTPTATLDAIFNFIRIDERTLTGGMPTAGQLRAAADAGVTAVINLATDNPDHSLADEAGLARQLGMAYVHIPIDWGNPTDDDFAAFVKAMHDHRDDTLLIHCVANYRVTAFYSLYALRHLGWPAEQADALRDRIWAGSDYPVWAAFIARKTAEATGHDFS